MRIWLVSTHAKLIRQIEQQLLKKGHALQVIPRLPAFTGDVAGPDILIIDAVNEQAALELVDKAKHFHPVLVMAFLPPECSAQLPDLMALGLDLWAFKPAGDDMVAALAFRMESLVPMKRNAQTVSQITEELKTIWELIPDGVLKLNDRGEILYANSSALKIWDYPLREIVGLKLRDLFSPHPELQRRKFQGCRHLDAIAIRKNTSAVPVTISCQPMTLPDDHTSWLLIAQDMEAQRRMEDALFDTEAKANAILNATVSAIITIDERGMIESFNLAAERIFGYKATEVIGANIRILMPEPYRREHELYMQNYQSTGVKKIIGIGREVVGKRKDGSTFPMDLAVSEVILKDRRIFSGIVRDLTKQRQLELEILRISEQERRNIGQDLHDGLGQMLTGLSLMADHLGRKLQQSGNELAPEAEKIVSYLEEADTFARSLARGLVPIQLEHNGLAAALERFCSQAEHIFRIKCNFEVYGEYMNYTDSYAIHLYRIVQEAISNAVRHGKASAIQVELAIGRDQLRLRIHDNGIGFPEKLKPTRGLGVQLMGYRARIMGGTLDIKSGPTGGTVITCTQPLGTGIRK